MIFSACLAILLQLVFHASASTFTIPVRTQLRALSLFKYEILIPSKFEPQESMPHKEREFFVDAMRQVYEIVRNGNRDIYFEIRSQLPKLEHTPDDMDEVLNMQVSVRNRIMNVTFYYVDKDLVVRVSEKNKNGYTQVFETEEKVEKKHREEALARMALIAAHKDLKRVAKEVADEYGPNLVRDISSAYSDPNLFYETYKVRVAEYFTNGVIMTTSDIVEKKDKSSSGDAGNSIKSKQVNEEVEFTSLQLLVWIKNDELRWSRF